MSLPGPHLDPQSGQADSLVILLHGYGADGNDLLGIGQALAPHMPNTRFMAPNAPQPCATNPMGYQWFPIPWMDGSTEADMKAGFEVSAGMLNAYLDAAADRMPPDRTVLVGFSQGTMMSLHVALRRPVAFAGIIGFSGRLLEPESLASEIASRPPVLLVHGDQDPLVPFESMAEAEAALAAASVPVQTHCSAGTAHGIAQDGLQVAFDFLNTHLG